MPHNLHLDYDRLAPTYNRRFAEQDDRQIGVALQRLASEIQAERVLEVGCGTGHWLSEMKKAASAPPAFYGLDLSAGMLSQASQHPGLRLSQGQAEALPFASGLFDLVYCVNALHHFSDGRYFIEEAARLLRPGAALAVAGMDPHRQGNDWYVYDYFAGVHATDLARFPSWGTVFDWMAAANLEPIHWNNVEVIYSQYSSDAVFEDPFLDKNACSQLALLSQADYQAGLESIRQAVQAAKLSSQPVIFNNTIYIDMLIGWKQNRL